MAGGAHVRVDSPMSTVSTPAHFGRLVHLDVFNHQRVHIQTLKEQNQKKILVFISNVIKCVPFSLNVYSFHYVNIHRIHNIVSNKLN